MRALKYFLTEAGESLWRRRRAAVVSVLTIAAGLFVLGFFLILNRNLERVVGRWVASAEMSVYLRDDASPEQLKMVDELIAGSGLAVQREYLSKEQASRRFREDFPEMAPAAAQLDANPFPASFEIQLRDDSAAGGAVENLARTLAAAPGVADVQYDRQWLARLDAAVRLVRGVALVLVVMLAVASALTVASVVRLAAEARREEIEIMQLVGAPHAYVRGPFIAEGILQGGIGAVAALAGLAIAFLAVRGQVGALASQVLGTPITFLPAGLAVALVAGGMVLGCIGGAIVARGVR